VVIDWDARPLPELPLPNDLATRPDPTSPTGLRLNISVDAATTELEARTRRKFDELTGFGIYQAITVRFDAPLDLDEIALRHDIDGDVSDDAFFLIDVTPGSPTYLQPAELDVGHGRFPEDVARPDAYFPNDPHADMPSLLFDTHDEDLNGNGELDWGEDIDNDGWLDVPNVYPVGGDPREDLLTWYERLTDTLIFRPVVPLREETTYAVVLTERLIGEDGNPVRSPWKYVNHTRQTAALQPLEEALPELGLSVDDVAFAWTYTTGRITGDLVDLRRSLDGEGPWAFMPEEYPPGITKAHELNDISALDDEFYLPVSTMVSLIGAMDFVPADAREILEDAYAFGDRVVGGQFTSPFLLADKDDGGGDEVDEWWQVDPVGGTVFARTNQVALTCVLPKATEDNQPPFDVGIWGHGYGSTRLEGFMFAWAFLRMGLATCVMDFPGHGPAMSPEEREQIVEIVEPLGMLPFLEHLEMARYVDTDNDGVPDSGSHQWSADSFHTRDQVRQAVLDWMWLIEALKQCGTGTMERGRGDAISCDWDDDGTPDIGGPDATYLIAGGSLGGIVNGVAAAVLPDVSAFVPVVAGGGLMDISTRAPTGGAVEAMHGKLMSPMFLGRPQNDGSLRVTQYVNNFMRMRELTVGTVPEIPAGGRVVVENLMNGEVREGLIPEDGRFRVGIPADALDYYEKRVATGIPDDGPEDGVTYSVAGNDGLGDLLVVTLYDADGEEVAVLDTFETDAFFEGVTYPAGSPLVAAASGLGRIRAAPDTRKLIMMIAMSTEPGDPISYAPHYFLEPFEALGGRPTNVLLVPNPGDMVVSINSEIALARTAGMFDRHTIDPRYDMTVDEWLIDRQVVRGLEEFGPWVDVNGNPCLFDADDLDNGTDHFGAPSDIPLRATVETPAGVSGMRLPYVNSRGAHAINMPDPSLPFDVSMFLLNQITLYMSSEGQVLSDDVCLESNDCDWLPAFPGGGR